MALVSGIVLPLGYLIYKKFKHFDEQFLLLTAAVDRVQQASDAGDKEQDAHWLNYYRNEIMKFMERIRTHPERIPTKEHYQAVFEHFQTYQELGGNHYIDLVMEQIEELYKQHYETGPFPPFETKNSIKK